MTAAFTNQELAAIADVRDAVALGMMQSVSLVITPFANDPKISAFAMMLGIAQAHIDGLASALTTLEPGARDRIITGLPAQIHAIIGRDGQ